MCSDRKRATAATAKKDCGRPSLRISCVASPSFAHHRPPATDPSRDDALITQVLEDAQEHGFGLDVLVETGTA